MVKMLFAYGTFAEPWYKCECCDVVMQIIFHRNPSFTKPEFCPFCGEEIEEWEEPTE